MSRWPGNYRTLPLFRVPQDLSDYCLHFSSTSPVVLLSQPSFPSRVCRSLSFFPNLVILSFPVTRFHPPLIISHPRLPPACSSAFDLAPTIDVSLPAR
jgi:hypothetical protein